MALWFEVTRHPTAEWLARQITEAFPWTSALAYLVHDNDRAYGHVFTSRVRAMGIRDRPISPGSPWQNGCAERLIGTLRRECLDQILIFGEAHLRRILSAYAAYYNQVRTHLALQKDAPSHRAVQRSGAIVGIPILAGLHHQMSGYDFRKGQACVRRPDQRIPSRQTCFPPIIGPPIVQCSITSHIKLTRNIPRSGYERYIKCRTLKGLMMRFSERARTASISTRI